MAGRPSNPDIATIQVALLDEGTVVSRPVQAVRVGQDLFQILESVSVPEGETWQFQPGAVVRCEPRVFAGGESGLFAFEQVRHVG